MAIEIHPTAIVSPGAKLADGVIVKAYSIVEEDVTLGEGTIIEPFVHILPGSILGKHCRVFEYTTVGREPQDYSFRNEPNHVIIGDNVTLRENVTVHRPVGEGEVTSVGNDCLIMEGVHIGHNVHVGNHVTMANKVGLAGHVVVGDRATIGGMAGIHQFVHIGRFCMVGGLSKIVKDVPPFTLVDGRPARVYGLNKVGLRRNGFGPKDRARLQTIYHDLYHSGLPYREAIERLRASMAGDPLAEEIVSFADGASRGLTPWPGGLRERKIDD